MFSQKMLSMVKIYIGAKSNTKKKNNWLNDMLVKLIYEKHRQIQLFYVFFLLHDTYIYLDNYLFFKNYIYPLNFDLK